MLVVSLEITWKLEQGCFSKVQISNEHLDMDLVGLRLRMGCGSFCFCVAVMNLVQELGCSDVRLVDLGFGGAP